MSTDDFRAKRRAYMREYRRRGHPPSQTTHRLATTKAAQWLRSNHPKTWQGLLRKHGYDNARTRAATLVRRHRPEIWQLLIDEAHAERKIKRRARGVH